MTWTTTTDLRDLVAEVRRDVAELVGPIRSLVVVDADGGQRTIRSERPGLLEQLLVTRDVPKLRTLGGRGGGAAAPITLTGLAVRARIMREVAGWTGRLGVEDLAGLGDVASELSEQDLASLARSVSRWRVLALCASPFEGQRLRPAVPCPEVWCEARSSIVAVVDDLDGERGAGFLWVAACMSCGATWDESRWLELREWVRWCSVHLAGPRHLVKGPDGGLIECTECAGERADMAERRAERRAGILAGETAPPPGMPARGGNMTHSTTLTEVAAGDAR